MKINSGNKCAGNRDPHSLNMWQNWGISSLSLKDFGLHPTSITPCPQPSHSNNKKSVSQVFSLTRLYFLYYSQIYIEKEKLFTTLLGSVTGACKLNWQWRVLHKEKNTHYIFNFMYIGAAQKRNEGQKKSIDLGTMYHFI